MTRRELVEQKEVLERLAKTYPHRTIENIIRNLDARIEEYDKEHDYICIKGNEYLQKGKVYKVRFDGEKYSFSYFTKNEHGFCEFNKKGLDKYFKRVRNERRRFKSLRQLLLVQR